MIEGNLHPKRAVSVRALSPCWALLAGVIALAPRGASAQAPEPEPADDGRATVEYVPPPLPRIVIRGCEDGPRFEADPWVIGA